ncbi:MAG: hypothetical protein IJ304_01120 [Clostridia bacterium]|nr:hypothetical protein [Clostridia bacterium]
MVGIIDIGSNTIRLVMYDSGKKLSNTAVTSEILHDTVDGHLTETGTQKLCSAIEYLKNEAKGHPVYAIATFAFRVLSNQEEVKKEIFEKTGVLIDILSGKDEAKCDFSALIREIGTEKTGIGVDLGGGSAQIFTFDKDNLLFFDSYPIGAKKIKKIFVENVVPTDEETEKIKKYIEKYVKRVEGQSETIYMMGGTAKTALRIYNLIKGTQNVDCIAVNELENLLECIKSSTGEIIKEVFKSRYDNIACGIMAMDEIAKHLGASKIVVLPCGVREGYLAMNKIE